MKVKLCMSIAFVSGQEFTEVDRRCTNKGIVQIAHEPHILLLPQYNKNTSSLIILRAMMVHITWDIACLPKV